MSIHLLHAACPTWPNGATAVGVAPIVFLKRLGGAVAANAIASLAPWDRQLYAPISRVLLRTICRDPSPTLLAKYACIMAWGGQRMGSFDTSMVAPGLPKLIQGLFSSTQNRAADFGMTQRAAANIPGLKISFYTKLPFFLRPTADAYILDQWTAKSSLLVSFPHVIRLGRLSSPDRKGRRFAQAAPDTTLDEYEAFCASLENFAPQLWPIAPLATGESTELAMFDRSRPDGFWRRFTRVNFDHPRAGNLLKAGAESLTTPLDYQVGLLVIRQVHPERLFVISIHDSCCHWGREDCYRLLLARLRELKQQYGLPVTVVLKRGPAPAWFDQALKDFGFDVELDDAVVFSPNPGLEDDAEPEESNGLDGGGSGQNTDACRPNGATDKMRCMKPPSANKPIYLQEGPKAFIKIVEQCGERNNLGMICKAHGHIWLKNDGANPRYLLGEIARAGGDFAAMQGYRPPPNGIPNCGVGGTNYQGGVPCGSVEAAIRYLKRYFTVRGCEGNETWTDAVIRGI